MLLSVMDSNSLSQGVGFLSSGRNTELTEFTPILNAEPYESIVETLDKSDSTNTQSSANLRNVSLLEDEFNKTLAEYTSTHKLYMQEIMNTSSSSSMSQYFGNVVSNNHDYIYINDYGFTQKYSTEAWNKNDPSCPSNVTKDLSDLSDLQKGADIGIGQPCKLAGNNIKNIDTGEIAWVDIKGYKHIYTDKAWKEKEISCDKALVTLSNDDFTVIPEGTAMSTTTKCDIGEGNPETWQKLNKLNNKLIELAQQISQETNDLTKNGDNDAKTKDDINKKLKSLDDQLKKLVLDKGRLNNLHNNASVKVGDNRNIQRLSTHLQYLIILILVVVFVLFIVGGATGDSSNIINIIILIFCIFVVTILSKWKNN